MQNPDYERPASDYQEAFGTFMTPEEARNNALVAEQNKLAARKEAVRRHRAKQKQLLDSVNEELSPEELAEAVEIERKLRAAYLARRAKAKAALAEQLSPEEREAELLARKEEAAARYRRRKEQEALLPNEEREELAANRAARLAAYRAKRRNKLTEEEKQLRLEANREKYRARAERKKQALIAAGVPLPKRGRPRHDGLGPDATPEELKLARRAKNRENQRRFKARKRQESSNEET